MSNRSTPLIIIALLLCLLPLAKVSGDLTGSPLFGLLASGLIGLTYSAIYIKPEDDRL